MTLYRRKIGDEAWHWCENCSNWPTSDFEERTKKPSSGELDKECILLEKEKKCLKKMFRI